MGYAPGSSVKYPEKKLNELREYIAKVSVDQSKILFSRKEAVYKNRLDDRKFANWLHQFSLDNAENQSIEVPNSAYFSFDDLDMSSSRENWNISDKELYDKIIRPNQGKYGPGLFSDKGQN